MRVPKFDARTALAFGITVAAVLGITGLAITAIASKEPDRSQNVLNAVLPLFGTWVGTVLAYYFSRDNFDAAAASTQQLVRELTPEQRLRSIPVASVMIRNFISVDNLDMKVNDVLQMLRNADVKRLPVLDPSGVLTALLYRDGILEYLLGVQADDYPNKTLSNLLQEKPSLNETPAFVSESATLAQARDAMQERKTKVALVTKSGSPSEEVVGLLTNTDIAAHARA